MHYFNTLPLISQRDVNNNLIIVNNLITRAYFLPKLLKNVTLFYEFDVKEIDTPENIAYKYYGDVNRYWIVLYANSILDGQSEWVYNSRQFELYLENKYSEMANGTPVLEYTTETIHHYEKIINTSNSTDFINQEIRVVIDKNTYDNLDYPLKTESTFKNGDIVTRYMDKKSISLYEYETELNESKRKISLLNSKYVVDVEQQFQTLMSK